MSYQVPANSPYVPCPRCQGLNVTPVKFTWWGGAVGPRILKLVKCQQCGLSYKGKTGQSPTRDIVIYTVVIFAIVFALSLLATI
ncbi:MAG: hypothetical protein H0T53_15870 [Herpetosiphonaceae bacterium]|nr:hypothetical protein [Herpetosiphonaceae bacterium]